MSWDRTILDLRRPLPDRDCIDDLTSTFSSSGCMARTTYTSLGAQMSKQLPFQRPASLHEQASIDCLVRHPKLRVLRVFGFEPACHLLGSPILLQLTCYQPAAIVDF